jgi:hypothetical protein
MFDQVYSEDVRNAPPEYKTEWLFSCIDQFLTEYSENALLVCDELTMLTTAIINNKAYKTIWSNFIATITSTGDSRNLYFWGVGTVAHTESLGINGGIRSGLAPVAIVGGNNLGAIQALIKTDFVKTISDSELATLRSASPVDRAFFCGLTNQWYSMPKLDLINGYCRDTRSYVGQTELQPNYTVIQDNPSTVAPSPVEPSYQVVTEIPTASYYKAYEAPKQVSETPDPWGLSAEDQKIFDLVKVLTVQLQKYKDNNYELKHIDQSRLMAIKGIDQFGLSESQCKMALQKALSLVNS